MEKEQIEQIKQKLEEKGAILPCPRCGKREFNILEGYFNQSLSPDFKNFVIGGKTIPSIIVVCTNCGFISQHALGSLGMLPTSKSE